MSSHVAVLGAGNGGQTMSADLALRGHRVVLYDHPDFNDKIETIARQGGVRLTGALEGFGTLATATTDIETAVRHADVVLVVVPSFAQRRLLELALPYLVSGQSVVLVPGNFGSLETFRMLNEAGIAGRVRLAETDSLPYACRQMRPGEIDVWGVKSSLMLAVMPGDDTADTVSAVQDCFSMRLTIGRNALETGFSNPNMVLHCSTMVLNAGRIECEGGAFMFYRDGMTESVCRVMESMDEERIAVGKALGLRLSSSADWLRRTYGLSGRNIHELVSSSPVYGGHGPDAPSSLKHRYLTEDVPYLLVPVTAFGRVAAVDTPTLDCIVKLASILADADFEKCGRDLGTLGLACMTPQEVLRYVQTGRE
jgi:opine dehydrogenase